jgi:hypothetical protein
MISQIDIRGRSAFNIIVAIFAMALALVSLTRAEPPQITAATALPYGQLTRVAPVAVAGAAISGLIIGAFYSLVPAWMQGRGNDRARWLEISRQIKSTDLCFCHRPSFGRGCPAGVRFERSGPTSA